MDVRWIDTATDDIGTVNLGRVTLPDDDVGPWSLQVINAADDAFFAFNVAFTNGEPATPPPPPPPPPVTGVGDFTGDGVADILWRHTRNGANTV